MKLYEELKWRGFIKDVSNEELAIDFLNNNKIAFYCGFDPTASSLTIGHLMQIIRILLLQRRGHKPIVLVGGGTGLIGDPSGRSSERKLLTIEDSLKNAEQFKKQFSKYVSFNGDNGAIMVNNYDWLSKINMLEFLRDYGKNFGINYMLAKDTVASRLDTGISYTEFSYMIIQSIDFLHLYKNYDCKLQFGGSDQWGNITAGLDLIRKIMGDKEEALGMTSPLLVKADGTKFGKSESGALWLDKEKTSPYELYQYLLNSSDADVINYLKTLTLLDKEIIDKLQFSLEKEPEKREAQKVLGKEVVTFIHGEEAYLQALKITEALFSGDVKDLTGAEIEQSFKEMPFYELSEVKVNIVDLLVSAGVVNSKREAREFIVNGAISINGEKNTDVDFVISIEKAIDGKYIIIRKGKKKYYLISIK